MLRCRCSWLFASLLFAVQTPAFAADIDPLDWPYWRGPEMNGVSRETGLPDKWSPDGENLVWKSEALGTRSTPIVLRNKLYTLCRHNPHSLEEAEKVVCADAATGDILWEKPFNVFLSDVPGERVGWSSVVGDPATGHVFALGVCGYFQCLDGETGKTIWSRSMSEEYGMLTTYGGRTNFPIVFENLVIISGVVIGWGDMAKPAYRILAFDKRNGQCVWFTSTRLFPEDTTYSSPVTAVIDGQAQLIIGAGDGSVYGLQPRTGKVLWNYDVSPRGINTAPLVVDKMVYCGHSEENLDDTKMGALFAIDPTKTGNITKSGEFWRVKEEFVGKSSPIVIDDRIYGIDDGGIIFINNRETGKFIGKEKIGTMGRGSPVYGDGKIYVADATGRSYIFQPSPKGLKKIHQLRLDVEINGSPIISHGKVFLPTETMMYAIGLPDAKPAATPAPPPKKESPVADDKTPATALLTPVESLLKPGQNQPLEVWLYNSKGQFLGSAKPKDVKYTVDGPGKVDATGKFLSLPDQKEHTANIITAAVGDLKAQARVRVIPEFPWNLTYDEGVIPVSGMGIRYRHIGIDHDYFSELKQRDPRAAKLYIFLMTQFINNELPAAKFNDATPQQTWTLLRRYLGLLEAVTNQETGQTELDPALKILKDDGVLKDWSWTTDDKVGTQLTTVRGPKKVTGNGVMCKITTIPRGAKSQGWLGHPGSKNYVIQADFMANGTPVSSGADPNSKMPNVGLINQRYRFDMNGAAQELKLYSWYPHDLKAFSVPFSWEADTWYTLKFHVTNEKRDGVEYSVCRGKAWKRTDPEPDAWSIEWADAPPNETGSPGLFGNATNTEVFVDNVVVTPAGK